MDKAVAVIGMGLMGAAIAARLRDAGRPVIVWNRTPSRCAPLERMGAVVADSACEAMDRADTIILVTTTTADVADFFGLEPGRLSGKDVVNLITGSPKQIRDLGERVERSGAAYLNGTIQCYPSNIGDQGAAIFFGGSAAAWERREPCLRALAGAAAYLGEKVDMPNIVDAGVTAGFFFSAMGACLEATSYAGREGVSVAELRPYIRQALKLLPAQLDVLLDAVERQQLGTTDATIRWCQRN